MLKKVPVDQLRLGMHLQELCGAWLEHPFWKTQFVLRDAAELKKLQDSSLLECWIDVSKGLDVVAPLSGVPVAAPPTVDAEAAADLARAAQLARKTDVPFDEEVRRAAALCTKSRAAVVSLFNEARMGRTIDTEKCSELVTEIAESVWRNPSALVSLARLKTHDDYTYMHSVAVAALMVALSKQMGQDETQARLAAEAGMLHDLGKALMPVAVLNKPGKLTDDEFTTMKTHPERGHELLLTGRGVDAMVLDVCLHHHEKMDGSGYPHRLQGEQISLLARMGSVCDVYDAITSNRPYKKGWDPAESITRMAAWSKGHFDEAVFRAFVTSLGIYPVGSLVRLRSGLLAVVTQQTPAKLTAPEVKVFFSTKQGLHVTPRLLNLADARCTDRIIGRESNEQWQFAQLDELWAGEDVLRKLGRKG
jgi:HD-GYP domain-containing protein (c-di-GMP phosphodiesterase class II)